MESKVRGRTQVRWVEQTPHEISDRAKGVTAIGREGLRGTNLLGLPLRDPNVDPQFLASEMQSGRVNEAEEQLKKKDRPLLASYRLHDKMLTDILAPQLEAKKERERKAEKDRIKQENEALREQERIKRDLERANDRLARSAERWATATADAILEGKKGFKSLISSMIQETARFYLAQTINRAMGMGNLSKSGHSPLIDLLGSVAGSLGGFFGGGTSYNAIGSASSIAASTTTAHSMPGFFMGMPSASTGINRVPRTAPYLLHEGEGVVSNAGGPGHMGGGKRGRMKQDMRPINIVLPTTVYGSGDGSFIDSFARQKQAATNLVLDELRRMRVL